ncbi:D-alanyl-D-alanine carboxypeptidase [Lyngbya aestuarii]|uniref:D-alanyl-D-alanine carboxypeptidase n=1 Tax=Lyngbya aestuarii TaxID=118322 RepID=UPI00403DC5CC
MSPRLPRFCSELVVSALIISGLMSSGAMALLRSVWATLPISRSTAQILAWQEMPFFALPTESDPLTQATMSQYLKAWNDKGAAASQQGIWIHSGLNLLATHQSKVPLPAASLTKIATTLAALERWGPEYQFETLVSSTGPVKEGVLQGDLVITGYGDPFFIWQEAIALGNSLEELGIRRVTGNLVIVNKFYMNYEQDPVIAGQQLRQAINTSLWSRLAAARHRSLPQGTAKPQVVIAGKVKVATKAPFQTSLLLRHRSLPLAQILREMNIYSNNDLAELLAQSVGGAIITAQRAASYTGIPLAEIQLVNGSGLGVDNRISPRAVVAMLMAIERFLEPHQLRVTDLFPVAGRDQGGTMLQRQIPVGTVVKTGTLRQVSALAGVMPTKERGLVWFAIINGGWNIGNFRANQDQFLESLSQKWGSLTNAETNTSDTPILLGDPKRNQKISDS